MGFDVKKTTKRSILDWLCPHYCLGCGRLGGVICKCCKNDILASNLQFRKKYPEVMMVGKRTGLLGAAIKQYKYGPVRALGGELASLLEAVIAAGVQEQAEEIVIVPLPTIAKHVRQRGFDHTWRMGRELARMGGWQIQKTLERANNTVQVGQDKRTREQQAQTAYRAKERLSAEKIYVLVDDVWTTGASMRAAKAELEKAGAKKIRMAVVAMSENAKLDDDVSAESIVNNEVNDSVS